MLFDLIGILVLKKSRLRRVIGDAVGTRWRTFATLVSQIGCTFELTATFSSHRERQQTFEGSDAKTWLSGVVWIYTVVELEVFVSQMSNDLLDSLAMPFLTL